MGATKPKAKNNTNKNLLFLAEFDILIESDLPSVCTDPRLGLTRFRLNQVGIFEEITSEITNHSKFQSKAKSAPDQVRFLLWIGSVGGRKGKG